MTQQADAVRELKTTQGLGNKVRFGRGAALCWVGRMVEGADSHAGLPASQL